MSVAQSAIKTYADGLRDAADMLNVEIEAWSSVGDEMAREDVDTAKMVVRLIERGIRRSIETVAPPPALKVKRLSATAIIPTRADTGSIGYDLYADHDVMIFANSRVLIKTGVAVAIPDGHYGRCAPRSGLAVQHGMDVFAGVIDPSYRGELMICLYNSWIMNYQVRQGDRIAQLILERASMLPVAEVDNLDETTRGVGGFGSSGK